MTIIWCMVPKIWTTTDRIFCHSGTFFALLPLYGHRKSKFWKNEQHTWYYHFTNVYHKWLSYDLWCLRYEVQVRQNFLSFWTILYPFTNLRNQNFEKLKKKPGDIIILHMRTINDNHMMYSSWDMKCERQNFLSF